MEGENVPHTLQRTNDHAHIYSAVLASTRPLTRSFAAGYERTVNKAIKPAKLSFSGRLANQPHVRPPLLALSHQARGLERK
jgi:hypothetical protein